jgi:hypothetical protein
MSGRDKRGMLSSPEFPIHWHNQPRIRLGIDPSVGCEKVAMTECDPHLAAQPPECSDSQQVHISGTIALTHPCSANAPVEEVSRTSTRICPLLRARTCVYGTSELVHSASMSSTEAAGGPRRAAEKAANDATKRFSARKPNGLCALVVHLDANLAQQRNTSLFKLKAHYTPRRPIQQSRPGLAMDFDRQSDNAFRQVSMFEHDNTTPRPSAALVLTPC